MEEEIFETHDAKIWLRTDGIIQISVRPQAETNLDDAIENINIVSKFSKDKKHSLFLDIRQAKFITRDARNYFSGEESQKYISALAILIRSPVSRVMGNLFIGINKPPYPVKLFTSEDSTIQWLKRYIE